MNTLHCTPIYGALIGLVKSPEPKDPLYSVPSNQSAFRGWLDSRQMIFDINRQMLGATNAAYTNSVDSLMNTVGQSTWHKADPSSPIVAKTKSALNAGTEFRKWVNGYNQLFRSSRKMAPIAKKFGMAANLAELLRDKKSISSYVINSSEEFDRSVVAFISLDHLDPEVHRAVEKALDALKATIEQI